MFVGPATLDILFTALNGGFLQGLSEVQQTWQRFSTLVPISTRKVQLPVPGQVSSLRRWADEKIVENITAKMYELEPVPFERTIGVDRHVIEDALGGQALAAALVGPQFEAREIGKAAARWVDEQCYEALDLGDTALGYDSVAFFASTHPRENGLADQSNIQAGGGTKWFLVSTKVGRNPILWGQRQAPTFVRADSMQNDDVFMTRQIKSGVEARGVAGYGWWQSAYQSKDTLDADNLDLAFETMMSTTNDKGGKLGIVPDLLVVGPSRRKEALDVLNKQLIDGGDSNRYYQSLDLIVSPYLD